MAGMHWQAWQGNIRQMHFVRQRLSILLQAKITFELPPHTKTRA